MKSSCEGDELRLRMYRYLQPMHYASHSCFTITAYPSKSLRPSLSSSALVHSLSILSAADIIAWCTYVGISSGAPLNPCKLHAAKAVMTGVANDVPDQ